MDTQGMPNADIPVVRIFCDYDADGVWGYPYYEEYYSWKTEKEADLEALESMGRNEDLRFYDKDWVLLRELEQWNAHFDRWYLEWTNFLQGWGEPLDLADFDPDQFTKT